MKPLLAALVVLAAARALWAQTRPSDVPLRFDVASVKRSASDTPFGISRPTNGLVRTRGAELRRLIAYAYGIEPSSQEPQPQGGPAWIDHDLFEVEARGPADLTLADGRRMMQTLLRERFNLRVHIETRSTPIYALVMARADGTLGPGLKRSTIDCGLYSDALERTGRLDAARAVSTDCDILSGGGAGAGRLQMKGRGTVRDFIRVIARSPDVDRPIRDHSNLTGTFDVDFVWAPDRSGPGAAATDEVVSIFSALREQLGLRLERRTEPVGVVIIDSVSTLMPN